MLNKLYNALKKSAIILLNLLNKSSKNKNFIVKLL